MMAEQLMILPQHVRDQASKYKARKGHAGYPGNGPEGETCKSCEHMVHRRYAGTYLKCLLMRAVWTGGAGTDVKAGDPACEKWEAKNGE